MTGDALRIFTFSHLRCRPSIDSGSSVLQALHPFTFSGGLERRVLSVEG